MAVPPSIQWYPGDWLRKPAVRMLSAAARGIWMDFLMLMHFATPRGQVSGTLDELARGVGCTAGEVESALKEFERHGTADVERLENGANPPVDKSVDKSEVENPEMRQVTDCRRNVAAVYTVSSRRLSREEKTRKYNAERQSKLRDKKKSNAPVAASRARLSSSSSSKQGAHGAAKEKKSGRARRPSKDYEWEAIGRAWGFEPKVGETMDAYVARVRAEWELRAEEDTRKRKAAGG